jgi:hypothetical protein
MIRKIALTSILVSTALLCFAQTADTIALPPKFSRQQIPGTTCAAYLPQAFVWNDPTASEDGSTVLTGSSTFKGGYEFGLIFVKFIEPLSPDPAGQEALLVSYLDFLKGYFDVKSAVGYGRGHRLKADTTVIGVIDYWQQKNQQQMAVKGWVNAQYLACYYISGPMIRPMLTAPFTLKVFA